MQAAREALGRLANLTKPFMAQQVRLGHEPSPMQVQSSTPHMIGQMSTHYGSNSGEIMSPPPLTAHAPFERKDMVQRQEDNAEKQYDDRNPLQLIIDPLGGCSTTHQFCMFKSNMLLTKS